jgi:zinc protease
MLRKILPVLLLVVCCTAQPRRTAGIGSRQAARAQAGVLRLPKAQVRRLPNGLQAIVARNRGSLRTVLELRVSAGSIHGGAGPTGVSEATAELLITDELRERLQDYGASIEVAASYGSFNTVFSLSSPREAFNEVTEIFFDAFAHPQFRAQKLASWKKKRVGELESDENSPSYLAESILARALYHDARQWTGPTIHSLEAIDVPALESFYRDFYATCRSWLGVLGPDGIEETMARLSHATRNWQACSPAPAVKLEETGPGERTVYLLHQPQMRQAYLRLGALNVYRLDPDYPSALVLNRILGGIPGGRLWQVMRQQKGSTYDVRSSLTALKYLHHFAISVALSPEGVKESIETLEQQLELLRVGLTSAEEVESAKSAILGEFLRTLESSNELLDLVMTRYIYGLPSTYWQSYAEELTAVSPQSVQAAAVKYLNPEHMQIIAIGNSEILKPQLEHQGIFHELQLHELEPQVASRK